MNKSSRRTLLLITSIFAVTCFCSLCIAAYSALEETIEVFLSSTATTDTTSSASSNPPGTSAIDPETLSQMARIESQVIELRGLQSSGDVTRIFYTPSDLRTRLIDDFFADYTAQDAAQDTRVLSLMGLLPPNINLHQLYVDLYSEGIAGFYDDESGEMVVVQARGFGGIEQLTYAHEYLHALQDQNYDLSEGLGYNDETCEINSEFCLALLALIEGDATRTEMIWFEEYAGERQRQEIYEFYGSYESPVFDDAPPFLQQDLLYAYTTGLSFVDYLYDQGGWPAVDAAYVDPPLTTEQILHPELYPDELPLAVVLPDLTHLLGDTWLLLEEDTLGEWYTFMMLGQAFEPAARLNEVRAREAAAGWGGDRYAVYIEESSDRLVMAVRHMWDTPNDAEEYAAAFYDYAAGRFGAPLYQASERTLWSGNGGVHLLFTTEGETIWIFSPDEDTALSVYDHITENG